jgi:hypothetical protein
VLEPVPQVQELRAVAAQLAGQLGGGGALGEAAEDQDQLAGAAAEAVQGRAGEGVEDPAAVAAAEVGDRGATAGVDAEAIVSMAPRAGQSVGVQPSQELGVAGGFVHQVDDREVHGGLRGGEVGATGISRAGTRP